MGEVIDLAGQLAGLEDNQDFVTDLCRFSESLLTESAVRKKYRLAESTWLILGENDSLVEKIEMEKLRRTRDGSSKREKAQQLVVRAPDVLGRIMDDDSQSARHRIDSCKVLNDFAGGSQENAATMDRFIIQINLGDTTLKFDKSITPNAGGDPYNDVVDIDTVNTPWGMFISKKDGGDGESI